jgi:hypothetical protein
VAAQGPSPAGGWRVPVPGEPDGETLRLMSGTTAVTSRGRRVVDPRTARPVQSPWSSVTVLGGGCVAAAALALGAHIVGAGAADRLGERGAGASRLVQLDGAVVTHIRIKDPISQAAPAAVLGVLSLILALFV